MDMEKKEIIERILKKYGMGLRYRSYGDEAGRVDFPISGKERSIFLDGGAVSISIEDNYEWFELETSKFEDDIQTIFRWLVIMGYPLKMKASEEK